MDGMTGRLFREFSIVISGSVIISSFAALTFTPMLATKLLIKREKQNWFYAKTEPFFEGMNRLYSRSLAAFLEQTLDCPSVHFYYYLPDRFLWNAIPAEMAPLEDRSQICINTRGAEGVTYEYIRDYTEDINQLVDSILPDAEAVTARVSSGSGNVRITLKDMKDRDYTQMEVAKRYRRQYGTRLWHVRLCNSSLLSEDVVEVCLSSMCFKLLIWRSWKKYCRKFMAKVYENPVFPDGRRRLEVQ